MRTTLFLCAAVFSIATPVAAQNASADTQIAKSVDTFQTICLAQVPNFPKDAKVFASRGYVKATRDPAVFGDADDGLAGLGFAGMEGGATNSPTPNGCLVYVKGLDAAKAAALVDPAMEQRFKLVERRKVKDDFYWLIRDFAPRTFIAFVAPKPQGNYAGRTLLMITEQVPQQPRPTTEKTPPMVPKDPKDREAAEKTIEALKKASPEERIAYFGALQFTQCLLATDFLKIEFDREMGVERDSSSTTAEHRFMDSTTGNLMMTNATQCMVGYYGSNIEVSLAGITPFVKMRDKNAQTRAGNNGYRIALDIDGKPHVITIARGQVQGRNLVRMMLSQGAAP